MVEDKNGDGSIAEFHPGSPRSADAKAKIDQFFNDLSFLVRAGHTGSVRSVTFSPSQEGDHDKPRTCRSLR